ncbi:hypothetical protein BDV25DRAFT_134151 [Aspergillus avenaceus]|uniref:Uncharacterized protein n=1 Tax=Aspergillus avenaceus TaxID=36643 RepID=A0A5N6TF80_ASPAV|nr:hypothetical protein BDV25DRAFT_134151 [Aspergillus avenaceus]
MHYIQVSLKIKLLVQKTMNDNNQPSLPIMNNALSGLVLSLLPKDTILHRHRSKFPQDSHTHTQESQESIFTKARLGTARANKYNNKHKKHREEDNADKYYITLFLLIAILLDMIIAARFLFS